jgi:two-component system, cell cycle response regulator DivK
MKEGMVLVIEDNARNLKLVRDVLVHDGYEVIDAVTAEEGIELAAERQPSLVLMDLQLPGMDGVEALHALRSSERTVALPVVAVTAYAMKDDRRRALNAGFDGYLTKPVSIHALRDEVRLFTSPMEQRND